MNKTILGKPNRPPNPRVPSHATHTKKVNTTHRNTWLTHTSFFLARRKLSPLKSKTISYRRVRIFLTESVCHIGTKNPAIRGAVLVHIEK